MLGIIFAVCISIGLPVLALVYAIVKKRPIPFLLGVLAFVGSQVFIRIPLLQYVQSNSTAFSMFSVMQPVLFAIVLGFSAGIFEGVARWLMMRFFMKQQDWKSGLVFGAGHGGIEAVLFVGVSAVVIMLSPAASAYNVNFFIGGIERIFAMLLHIGLSIIVLQGVVQRKFLYIVAAIFIHGFVDSLVGIFPLLLSPNHALIALEASVAVIASAVFIYSISIKRKGVLQ